MKIILVHCRYRFFQFKILEACSKSCCALSNGACKGLEMKEFQCYIADADDIQGNCIKFLILILLKKKQITLPSRLQGSKT